MNDFCTPQKNILQLGFREGMRVADIGTGSGHYALALSPIVGPEGRVYAIDVQEGVLKRLKQQAIERGMANIETIWADVERPKGTRFRDAILDGAVVSNVLFQFEHKERVVRELKRVLKPGGKVLVIDWTHECGGMGPDRTSVVPEHVAEKLFLDEGFYKEKSFRAGQYHYALVFSKPQC